jgi:hypothetical protein
MNKLRFVVSLTTRENDYQVEHAAAAEHEGLPYVFSGCLRSHGLEVVRLLQILPEGSHALAPLITTVEATQIVDQRLRPICYCMPDRAGTPD